MNKVNEPIAVEWSFKQKGFNYTPLSHAIAANLRSLRDNKQAEYSVVAIVQNADEATKLIAELKSKAPHSIIN